MIAKAHTYYNNGVENKQGAINERDFSIILENQNGEINTQSRGKFSLANIHRKINSGRDTNC